MAKEKNCYFNCKITNGWLSILKKESSGAPLHLYTNEHGIQNNMPVMPIFSSPGAKAHGEHSIPMSRLLFVVLHFQRSPLKLLGQ